VIFGTVLVCKHVILHMNYFVSLLYFVYFLNAFIHTKSSLHNTDISVRCESKVSGQRHYNNIKLILVTG